MPQTPHLKGINRTFHSSKSSSASYWVWGKPGLHGLKMLKINAHTRTQNQKEKSHQGSSDIHNSDSLNINILAWLLPYFSSLFVDEKCQVVWPTCIFQSFEGKRETFFFFKNTLKYFRAHSLLQKKESLSHSSLLYALGFSSEPFISLVF